MVIKCFFYLHNIRIISIRVCCQWSQKQDNNLILDGAKKQNDSFQYQYANKKTSLFPIQGQFITYVIVRDRH